MNNSVRRNTIKLMDFMKKFLKILFFVLAVSFGIFLIVFGEHDDSPGAQGLGLLLIIVSIISMIKKRKNVQ